MTSAIMKAGYIVAADLKICNQERFLHIEVSLLKQPRMRTQHLQHQSCCIWGDYFEMVNLL